MDDEKIVNRSIIKYHVVLTNVNDETYFLLYDKYMNPSYNVFEYINFYLKGQAYNSKSKALHAMKFLFCFQDIICKELKDFTTTDLLAFKDFLRGYNRAGNLITYKDLTGRSAETVNGYLCIYRSFLEYLGESNKYLNQRIHKKNHIWNESENDIYVRERYKINEIAGNNQEVPMYISVIEFIKIIQLIRKEYSIRDECIVRLMYETGMRIGEVLGLTNEDIAIEKIDGEYRAIIYIRNRTSDNKKSQHAKTCMKIYDKKQYVSKEYHTPSRGYQMVFISEELYSLIGAYVEKEHEHQRMLHEDNYFKSTIADCVLDTSDENFYIFLNSLGRPLSNMSWNNIIREIFVKLNIPLDVCVREHNINHRFRHGFAMFQVDYLHIKSVQLAVLMRHTTISSVMKYYRPTTSDKIRVKMQFANSLYEMFPELEQFRENVK